MFLGESNGVIVTYIDAARARAPYFGLGNARHCKYRRGVALTGAHLCVCVQ